MITPVLLRPPRRSPSTWAARLLWGAAGIAVAIAVAAGAFGVRAIAAMDQPCDGDGGCDSVAPAFGGVALVTAVILLGGAVVLHVLAASVLARRRAESVIAVVLCGPVGLVLLTWGVGAVATRQGQLHHPDQLASSLGPLALGALLVTAAVLLCLPSARHERADGPGTGAPHLPPPPADGRPAWTPPPPTDGRPAWTPPSSQPQRTVGDVGQRWDPPG